MNILFACIGWFKSKFGEDKFLRGPYAEEGWIGGTERIVFKDRPDPLRMSFAERRKEVHRQIREDVK